MERYKLQIGCLIIIGYIALMYLHGIRKLKRKYEASFFDAVLATSFCAALFDLITLYTVNHLETVPDVVNRLCHACYLVSMDLIIFLYFYYLVRITGNAPKTKNRKLIFWLPFIINMAVVLVNIGNLEFCIGRHTNYSMGISVYTCFMMMAVYFLASIFIFLWKWKYIEDYKRLNIVVYLVICTGVTIYQMIYPESLVACLGNTMMVLSLYINMKNPARMELDMLHKNMVYSFANIIESRDGSTGAHVRRTTAYTDLIVRGLNQKGYYGNILTEDYVHNLLRSAPLHDIGKIAVPDRILQKPGRLTDEEFAQMKEHSAKGEEIIRTSLGCLGDEQFVELAGEVALNHHEKWNGCGYPNGKSGKEIPLCARIVSIADVFDAVSEKRCYRDALPLEQCFDIIKEGSGSSFEPLLVDIFMEMKEEVIAIHESMQEQ